MVDHIKAHKGDMRLFWDRSNWQPMTRACNSRKAIRSEGGFGRPIKVFDSFNSHDRKGGGFEF